VTRLTMQSLAEFLSDMIAAAAMGVVILFACFGLDELLHHVLSWTI